MKKLYETKIDDEIELISNKAALEKKKFKIENINSFALLENFDNTKLNLTRQNVKIEPNSLGQNNEPSTTQTVTSKDISNPLMGKAFPKSLTEKLTQQIAEILKKYFNKEAEPEAQDKKNSPKEKEGQDQNEYL